MYLEREVHACQKAVITCGTVCSALFVMIILTSCTPTFNITIRQLEFKPTSEKLHYTVGIRVPKQVEGFVYAKEQRGEIVQAELGQGVKLNAYRAFVDCFDRVVDLGDANKSEGVDYLISFEIGKIEYLSQWRSDIGALGGQKRLFSVELIGVVSDSTGKELYRRNGVGKVECVRAECKAKNETYEKSSGAMIGQTLAASVIAPVFGLAVLHSNINDLISNSFEISLKQALEECRIQLIQDMRSKL
jgi:hypothetical protein